MNKILELLLTLWQLPQILIGVILLTWYRSSLIECSQKEYATIFCATAMKGAISLGSIIIGSVSACNKYKTMSHEYGHSKQSLILGPLYLFVIGIPSLIWAITYKEKDDNPNGYFEFYTEKWADKLGNVVRD